MKRVVAAMALAFAASCGGDPEHAGATPAGAPLVSGPAAVDAVAERFVKLGLALGRHDPNYVDAFSGPTEWADAAKSVKTSLGELEAEARAILASLDDLATDGVSEREAGLRGLVTAALTRIRMARGERFPFNDEARLLYGVEPPAYSLGDFDAALAGVEALLPGEGPLAARVSAFRNSFVIPADRLQAVFDAAIAECKRRTLAHYRLPETENFILRFVTDKPWSGYNWYQGDFESVIEINTSQPIFIDRAVDLGCHEGYPGHHVWNLMVDEHLRRGQGWIEFSILPLFSPQALIGEGSANYGVELAFSDEERLVFERDVLFPLAGLDAGEAEKLQKLTLLRRDLSHVDNFVAREYLEGRLDRAAAAALIEKYKLETPALAARRIDFFDTYRAYVITYTLGRDLVAAHIEREKASGTGDWEAFANILKSPDALGVLTKS